MILRLPALGYWWLTFLFCLWIGIGGDKTVLAQTTEICNNGIDDDGDRLVDCQDPDCPECARFISCVQPNTCYMPPTWADPKSPTAVSDPTDNVYGAQDLVLSTNADFTTVTIRTLDGSYTRTVVVTSTGSTIVQLPLAVVMSNSPNTVQRNKGLIITSTEPVQATYRQTPGLNQDIVPLKCRAALGYAFYAGSQTRLTATNVPNERHFVSVMATQPNTVVTFRAPAGLSLAGVGSFPVTVTLQEGETYMLASRLINNGANSENASVSGVLVTSTQPIVVNSGSQHTGQPYSGNRDAGLDQLVPARTVGTSYVALHGQNTTANSDYVFVVAIENGTTVSIAGPATVGGASSVLSTTTLSAGQVFTYNLPNVPNRAYTINTSKKSYVYHVSSYAANEFGMGILPTINPCNGSKRIDFYRTTGSSNDQAVVMVPTAGLASLTFRGSPYTTYGTVVDNITVGGVAYSVVSFPNSSINAAGVVNTVTSTERFHVGVVSNTGGASTGNFGFYSNYEAQVDVLSPSNKQPTGFYTVAQVRTGVATPHCLTLTSCGSNDRITGIVNGTYTEATSFTGSCLTYTMKTSAPKCARDTIRVQVENDIGRQGIVCLEFVNIDNDLITSVIPEKPVICQPGGSTSLTIVASQIVPGSGITYTYQTITPDKQLISTSIVSGTATGQFRISVTDSNGCRDTSSVFARPETASIAFGIGPATVCQGSTSTYSVNSTTGTYGWTITGGTVLAGGTPTSSSVTVRWTGSGSVRVTVTSGNGCTAVATRSVALFPSPTPTATTQNPLCNGTSTGSVNLAVTGGTSPYSYRWSNGATTEDLANIPAGVYSVTVTDRNGCLPTSSQPLMVTLTNATALSAVTNRTNLLCNGATTGTAGITASGGILPYRYQWSTGATTQNITGLAAGSYTVKATDANGCLNTQVVSITQPAALSPITSRTNVACNGAATGSISLSVTGGTPNYTYRWSDGNTLQNRTGLTAGTYSVTITDANNCTATTSVLITEPTTLTLSTIPTNGLCNGAAQGGIDLTVSGGTAGYSYRWNNPGGQQIATTEDVSGLTAGVYSVTVTDANACTRTLSATINQPTALSLTLTPRNPTCNGGLDGAITLTVGGGTVPQTVRWSDGNTNPNRTGLAAGTYSVTATDANGCSVTATTSLTAPNALIATANVTNAACSGGSTGAIDVTPSGGTGAYSYTWNTGATTQDLSNLPAGEYSVRIRDANGCSFTLGAAVRQPNPLSVTVLTTDAPCFGGRGDITTEVRGGTPAYSYRWNNGATSATIFALMAGTYQLVVTDVNGCTAQTSAVVNQPPDFAINAVVVPVSCNGGANASIDVTIEGGTAPYRYRWSTRDGGPGATSQDLSNLPAGVYSLTVTDANNCIERVDINVQEPALVSLSQSQTNVSCFGGANGIIDITVTGGTRPYSFSWTDGITTEDRTTLTAGTYRLTMTDKNGCATSLSAVITQPSALTVVPSVTAVSCNGGANGAVSLNVSGGISETSDRPYRYAWTSGSSLSAVTGLVTGVYAATVTDANNCSLVVQNRVDQPTALTVNTTQQNILCNGGNNGQIMVTVSGGTPNPLNSTYSYRWNDRSTAQNRTGLSAGIYSLTVTDANNCTQTRSFTLTQPTALSLTGAVQPVACFGGNTGAISLTVSGGVGPYDTRWNDNNTTQNRTGLTAGSYSVTLTDANSCTISRTFSVSQPTALSATGGTRNISCFNGSDGTISLSVSGGTVPYSFIWTGTGTTVSAQNQTGLAAGFYSVAIRDANGCVTTRSFSLTQPDALRESHQVTPVSCQGGNNGAITLTASGGTTHLSGGAYRYRWNTGATTQNLSGLTAGIYSVTITDAQQCTLVTSATVSQPTALTLSGQSTPTRCFGDVDGTVDLTVSGGTAPYRYLWNGGATTEDLTGVSAGTYTVTVRDFNNCVATTTVVVSQPPAMTLTLVGRNNLCVGDIYGAINLTVTGGTPGPPEQPYRYVWYNLDNLQNGIGRPDQNVGDLLEGSYTVVVTDANGCTATGSTTLTAPPRLMSVSSTTNVGCFGSTDGAISVSAWGGVPATTGSPYSYSWVDGYDIIGPNTPGRTNLPANVYTVTIRDQNGCFTTEVITINQPSALSLTGASTSIACNGATTGSVSVTALGGTSPYTYQWADTGPNSTSANRTNLPSGAYSVTVTDANRCAQTLSLAIAQPTALTLLQTVQNVSCDGGTNGSVSLTVAGGVPETSDRPYRYQWSTGATTQNLSNLPGGNYSVIVTDANGCTIAASVAVEQPLSLTASVLGTDAICNGQFGTITTEVRGGTPAYSYLWSNRDGEPGSTGSTINGLPVGSYTVVVTDANGCTASAATSVSQPQPFNLNAVVVPVSCQGGRNGRIDLTAEGSTPPYRYRWSNGATTEDVSGLLSGIYSVTVLDVNNCVESTTINVGQPGSLMVSLSVVGSACFGNPTGQIIVMASGGTTPYTYRWATGSTASPISTSARTGLSGGAYSVTVTDANGCVEVRRVILSQPTALSLSGSVTAVACKNGNTGRVQVLASGGRSAYQYRWSTGQTGAVLSSVATGVYAVTATDASACSLVQSYSVAEPTALSLNTQVINVACNGAATGAITLIVTGGTAATTGSAYTYRWNDGVLTANRSGLVAGSYSVTATDVNGCVILTSVSVSQPTALSVTSRVQDVSCNGGTNGTASLTVTGGVSETSDRPYRYQWSTGATTQNVSNLPKGNYSVTVTDANGCTIAASVAVEQPLPLTASVLGTDAVCNGQFGTITTEIRGGTPAYSYLWSSGSTGSTINDLPVGNYTLTVTDANGCTASAATSVSQPQPFNLNAVVVPVTCQGGANGSIDLTAQGSTPPYRYRWSNGATTQDVSGLLSGIYSVTVLDVNNCVESTTINVNQPGSLSVSLSSQNLTCFANETGQISITATGGIAPYVYRWTDNNITSPASTSARTGLAAGTYSVTVTDANGCSEVRSANLAQPTTLSLTGSVTAVACNGDDSGAVSVTASGGTSFTTGQPYTYNWQNPNGSPGANTSLYTNLTTGLYSVTASDNNGCFTTLSLSVAQPTALSLVSAVENVSCDGGTNGTASLTVSGGILPYRYAWSNGATTQNLTNLPKGNYSVTVTDANGCTIAASVAVTQPLPLTASVLGTDAICNGQFGTITTEVRGGTPSYSYLWSSGSTGSTINDLPVGNYTLTVTDANGCTASAATSVSQPQPFNLNAVVVPVSCQGGANGSIDLTAEGSTPPYRYRWSNGATTEDVSGLLSGIYSVTVLDVNDCVESTTINVGQPGSLSVSLSSQNLTCFENATGQISLTATGGIGPYTYAWTDNSTASSVSTPNRTGLPSGFYSVTVTDANGCTEIRAVTVAEPTALTILCSAIDVSRNGEATGSLSVTVLGGTPLQLANTYQYQWNTGATSSQIISLTAGVYALTVTDANGCFEIKSLTVGQATALSVSSTSVNVACFGGSTGQVSVTPTGGVGPYTYTWTGSNGTTIPGNTSAQTGLPAGTYSVTITDANGATLVNSVIITQPPALTLTPIVRPVSCHGGSDGIISLSVSGGSTTAMTGMGSSTGNGGSSSSGVNGSPTGYSYAWSAGASSTSISSLTTGIYSVTVTDVNGCTALQSVSVGQPSALSIISTQVNVAINGQSTGAIDLTVTGGTATTASGYSYVWSDASVTTEDRSGLSAGVYSVTARDANGCVISTTVTITESTALTLTGTPTDVSCNSGSNGSVSLTVAGGVSPYAYRWSDGSTTEGLSNLPKGNYEVIVTDANGATAVASFAVSQPPALTVSALPTDAICNGLRGSATVEVRGGTPNYTYQWTSGSGPVSTSSTVNGLDIGSYSLVVTDANGCTASTGATIGQPEPFNLNAVVVPVSCQGGSNGSIDLTVQGSTPPYRYRWNTRDGGLGATTEDVSGLAAGIYSVTVIDANNCVESTTINVGQPEGLSVALSSQNLTCFGNESGQVSLTASGGIGPYTYIWVDGQPNNSTASPASTSARTGLEAGLYSVTVLDANGCSVTQSITVNQPTALTVTGTVVDVTRNGEATGQVSVTVTGGTSFTPSGTYTYRWNTPPGAGQAGETTATLNNLPAGIYSVTATDANGCSETRSFTISEPPALTLETSVQNVACSGGSNGVASVTATGGVSPYTYRWSNRGDGPGATSQTATNLPKGNYEVVVTDANGATAIAGVAVAQPLPLTVSALPTNALCFGETGTTTVEVRGGTADYSYRWTTLAGGLVSTSATIQSLPTGTYRVLVTDANGCTATTRATVGQPDPFNLNAIVTTVKCQGGSDGKIDLLVEGATQPYHYKWSNGATSEDIESLTAGAYSVTVTDANNCTQVTTIDLGQPESLSVALSSQNLTCFANETGQVSLTATGGIAPYTYIWVDGQPNSSTASPASTSARTGLEAGAYSVTVLDANGCSVTQSITVNQPTALTITGSTTDVTRNGEATGTVSVSASGGTPGSNPTYRYQWSSGATTATVTSLTAGIYSVTVIDANGCSEIQTFTVAQPTTISVITTSVNVACFEGSTGQVSVTPAGGVGPYTYTWTDGNGTTIPGNTSAQTGLPAGTYSVTITDANGATLVNSVIITQPSALTLTPIVRPVSCNSGSDGIISLSVSGGSTTAMTGTSSSTGSGGGSSGGNGSATGYSYQWNTGASSTSISSLTTGIYSVTVTDANGCTALQSVSVGQPSALSISSTQVNVAINGQSTGAIDLTVTGGTATTASGYSYVWSDASVTTEDRSGLSAGVYSVTARDANGCVISTTLTITEPPALTLETSVQNVACSGGSNGVASVTATGGVSPYTYRWSNRGDGPGATSQTATNLPKGNYEVVVTDANGATAIAGVAVAQPLPLTVSALPTNALCFGETGTTTVEVRGGTPDYSYRWTTLRGGLVSTSATIQSLPTGTYRLLVTDANGCTATTRATVGQPDPFNLNAIVTTVKCQGGSDGKIDLLVEGATQPYRYRWDTGATTQDIESLTAGVYSVTVIDANNCVQSTTINLGQPEPLNVTLTSRNLLCFGDGSGQISLTATGGIGPYTYVWDDAEKTSGTTSPASTSARTDLSAGPYSVTVLDANGCSVVRSLTVVQPTALSLTSSVVDVVVNGANTGRVSLTVSGGTPLPNGPYTYRWMDGTAVSGAATPERFNLPAGVYSVTVTDANGCVSATTLVINQPTALTIQGTVKQITCDGLSTGQISLTTVGGVEPYRYRWNTGATSQNLNGIPAGNYEVLVTDANGATATAGFAVTQPLPLTASVLSTDALCNGQTGTVTTEVRGGTPDYQYLWSNRDGEPRATTNSVYGLAAGSYTLTVTDANGCQSSVAVGITQPQPFDLNAVVVPVSCRGGANGNIDLTVEGATQPYRYQWSTGSTTQDIQSLTAGTYSVTVTDANNCVKTTSIIVQEPPSLSVAVRTSIQPTCYDGANGSISLTATGGSGPYSYVWTDGGTISTVSTANRTGLRSGVYSVTVSDANGCSAMQSVSLGQGTRPNVRLATIPSTLSGPTPRNDGQLILGGFDFTDRFDISLGAIYSGSAVSPGSLSVVPADGVLTRSLPNPSTPQPYTVRVFDALGCSTDVTVILPPSIFVCPPAPVCLPVIIQKTRSARKK